ncbi:MAG TPA: hypothetical protein VIZ68_06735 [Thermoplasmata archaeon]
MQHRIAFAIALVVVLVGSLFVALPSAARGASTLAPSGAPHPSATDDVFAGTTPGCGVWTVGFACGGIYFTAYDPSDTTAVVSLHDQNASRDGFGATVKSWNVSFVASPFNDSYSWNGYFELPLTLQFGGWWNITINGTVGGVFSSSFYVHSYSVGMVATQGAYLSRHAGTAFYFVNQTVNNAARASVDSLVLTGLYYTSSGTWVPYPGSPITLPNATWGSFGFTVPSDASTYGYIEFMLYANVSAGTYPNTEIGQLEIHLGFVGAPIVNLATCASGCLGSNFPDGTPVYVETQFWINAPGAFVPAAGLTVTFEFDAGVLPVTPLGGYPTTVTTNATGQASILFIATTSVFPVNQVDSVKVSASDPLNAGSTYGPTTVTFNVMPLSAGSVRLQLTLDSAQYFAGDTVTATWMFGGLNVSLVPGWMVDAWWAWASDANVLVANGTLGSTDLTGHFSFPAPVGYGGHLVVQISAHNATSSLGASRTATVSAPTILLNPSEAEYLPGDTVTVSVTTFGSVFANATLYESVVDSSGSVLENGVLSGHEVSFLVPAVGATSSITVSVAGQDSTLGLVGQASITVYEGSGLVVQAGVSTPSNYIDGSYQPGQTITVHFQFEAMGSAVLSKSYYVQIFPASGFFLAQQSKIVETAGTSGDLTLTIPSDSPSGSQAYEVVVTAGACSNACFGGTIFSVNVQSNPSALGYQLGAGSGLTVAWLILLILILLVAVVLVLMMRGRSRPVVMKPLTPVSMTPGATSSSDPGPSGADDNPPLPKPSK